MKHRLFWKFLLAFWAALLVVALMAVLGGRLLEQHFGRQAQRSQLNTGPHGAMMLDTVQLTLQYAGAEALKKLLSTRWTSRDDRVYVIDAEGRDLLGRQPPSQSLAEAFVLTVNGDGDTLLDAPRQGGFRPAARRVVDRDGRSWLLFVPEQRPSALAELALGRPASPPAPAFSAGHPGMPWLVSPEGAGPAFPAGADGSADPRPGAPGPGHGTGPGESLSARAVAGAGERLAPAAGPWGPPPRPDMHYWGLSARQAQILMIALAVLASFVFAALLAWSMTRPLRALRQAFDAAAEGRLETRVRDKMGRGRDEITELGGHFDHMVEKIQNLLKSQQRLLHDVSHELRSPLARLQAASDLARQKPERLQLSLDRIDRETGRLDQMIGQLLTLSRLEAGTSDEEPVSFDLRERLLELVADADFEARAQDRTVSWTMLQPEAPVMVCLREALIYRACENLVRNAIKFTAPGTGVELCLDAPAGADSVTIRVMDRGPGVPPDQLDEIFRPFFRSASARGVDGYGLGLAIVQQTVLMHQGHVQASERPGGGLTIEMTLPRQLALV